MTLILLILIAAFTVYLIEMLRHQATLRRLPVRIHVNGTRGKSSVTRLIAAGIRAGGKRAFAKTTGSAARLIHTDGTEEPIVRHSGPNIREQLAVMRKAAAESAEVLVIECMAVRPDLQRISEKRIVRSTIGVITNIRPDHLEVMGPRLEDVAIALSSTTPRGGHLFSTEVRFADFLRQKAEWRSSDFTLSTPAGEPSLEEMERFAYVEIPENVGLALDVCSAVGIPRETALEGMWQVTPDPGATTRTVLKRGDKTLTFLNVFAANDSHSIAMLWKLLGMDQPGERHVGVLVSNRADRMRRAQDMAEICGHNLIADIYFAAGAAGATFVDMCTRMRVPRAKIVNIGGLAPEPALDKIFDHIDTELTIMGIGNIHGFGHPFIELLARLDAEQEGAS